MKECQTGALHRVRLGRDVALRPVSEYQKSWSIPPGGRKGLLGGEAVFPHGPLVIIAKIPYVTARDPLADW